MNGSVYLTPEELSDRLKNKVAVGTLKQWRHQKKGPPYTRAGNAILYPLDGVVAWEKANTIEGGPHE